MKNLKEYRQSKQREKDIKKKCLYEKRKKERQEKRRERISKKLSDIANKKEKG